MESSNACQVISNAEALGVLAMSNKRLKSIACTLPKERRHEVKWVVSRCARYLQTGTADPVTATRVLDALAAVDPPLPHLTRLKLLNARADSIVGVYLADDNVVDQAGIAEVIAAAWAGTPGTSSTT